jgi:hypothetical protein
MTLTITTTITPATAAMDTTTTLMWILSLLAAYPLVFLTFNAEPLRRLLHSGMRVAAIALATLYLTTRLIRTEIAEMPTRQTWVDTPVPQAAAITIFFAILAHTGAASLVVGAALLILADMAWILDTRSARAAE